MKRSPRYRCSYPERPHTGAWWGSDDSLHRRVCQGFQPSRGEWRGGDDGGPTFAPRICLLSQSIATETSPRAMPPILEQKNHLQSIESISAQRRCATRHRCPSRGKEDTFQTRLIKHAHSILLAGSRAYRRHCGVISWHATHHGNAHWTASSSTRAYCQRASRRGRRHTV